MKKHIALLIAVLLLFSFAGCGVRDSAVPAEETSLSEDSAKDESVVPDSSAAESVSDEPKAEEGNYADILIRDYGTVTIELDHDAAPETVDNFIKLARSGFYDGLTFHRIINGFMMQGGDPLGNGLGGAPDTIKGEFSANGWNNPLSHTAGAISMARAFDVNSASSQFFIVHQDSPFLDGQYAVFGYVTDGMDIVDKICREAKPVDNNGTIPADQQPVMESVTIR